MISNLKATGKIFSEPEVRMVSEGVDLLVRSLVVLLHVNVDEPSMGTNPVSYGSSRSAFDCLLRKWRFRYRLIMDWHFLRFLSKVVIPCINLYSIGQYSLGSAQAKNSNHRRTQIWQMVRCNSSGSFIGCYGLLDFYKDVSSKCHFGVSESFVVVSSMEPFVGNVLVLIWVRYL